MFSAKYFEHFLDIDECAVGGYCDGNATCLNNIGSFECRCNIGFNGTGASGDCTGECTLVKIKEDNSILVLFL